MCACNRKQKEKKRKKNERTHALKNGWLATTSRSIISYANYQRVTSTVCSGNYVRVIYELFNTRPRKLNDTRVVVQGWKNQSLVQESELTRKNIEQHRGLWNSIRFAYRKGRYIHRVLKKKRRFSPDVPFHALLSFLFWKNEYNPCDCVIFQCKLVVSGRSQHDRRESSSCQ